MNMYILEGKKPILTQDMNEWGKFNNNINNRRVAYHEKLEDEKKIWSISTVFLGIEYSTKDGKPLLWETLIYDHRIGDEFSDFIYGYTSYNKALITHLIMLDQLQRGRIATELFY